MHPASVGFQCPSCVREGSRSTGGGRRAAYGGRAVRDARLTTFVLIGLNVAVWLLILATGRNSSPWVARLSLIPSGRFGGPHGGFTMYNGVAQGDWWQLVTSAFVHVNVIHIGLNMVTLFFIGPPLEAILGRARFVALYVLSALTGSAAVMWFANPHVPTLGASGALFGLMGALLVIAFKVHGNYQQVLVWIGINLIFTFTAHGISWEAHIGGLIGGGVLAAAIAWAPRKNRSLIQWSSYAVVAVVALVLVGVRAAALA